MSTALLTPINRSKSVNQSPKRWRKQILPLTTINYKGRTIKFDQAYMEDLIRSFKDRAYDAVPLQFADASNVHTDDPERTRGRLIDVELTADGLDGIFDLGSKGEKVVTEHPWLGVSAKILENYVRDTDGKAFPRAIKHVLGTLDPRVTGMKPWQQINLSSDEEVTETIDLSAEDFSRNQEDDEMPDKPELVSVELTAEQHAALLEVLADQQAVKELNLSVPTEEVEETEEAEEVEPEEEEETEEEEAEDATSLTADQRNAIELANATASTAQSQVTELANQLRQAQVDREIDALRNEGLAPAIIEAARPALELAPQAIELSNGDKVDPGRIIRDVLGQVIELSRTGHDVIDLDVETGVLVGSDGVQAQRKATLDAWDAEYGN